MFADGRGRRDFDRIVFGDWGIETELARSAICPPPPRGPGCAGLQMEFDRLRTRTADAGAVVDRGGDLYAFVHAEDPGLAVDARREAVAAADFQSRSRRAFIISALTAAADQILVMEGRRGTAETGAPGEVPAVLAAVGGGIAAYFAKRSVTGPETSNGDQAGVAAGTALALAGVGLAVKARRGGAEFRASPTAVVMR